MIRKIDFENAPRQNGICPYCGARGFQFTSNISTTASEQHLVVTEFYDCEKCENCFEVKKTYELTEILKEWYV